MAFCTKCGAYVSEPASFCTACGAPFNRPQADNATVPESTVDASALAAARAVSENPPEAAPVQEPPSRKLHTPIFLWSFANALVAILNLFGLAGLALTILAIYAPTRESEKKRLHVAMRLNLIASVLTGVFLIALAALYVIRLLSALPPA